jgi:hypothetical protein
MGLPRHYRWIIPAVVLIGIAALVWGPAETRWTWLRLIALVGIGIATASAFAARKR